MLAREMQARNLAEFLVEQARKHNLPIVIHGKAYKPDVSYCIGSYSTLIGYYVQELGQQVFYVDPLADDQTSVVLSVSRAVVLMAHNRSVTYNYVEADHTDYFYYDVAPGSIIVDPWRQIPVNMPGMIVIHYGNTRQK